MLKTLDIFETVMWQKSGKKVVKSGTSSLRKVWKSLSAIQGTIRSSKTLRNLLQERLSITRNFESDLPVLIPLNSFLCISMERYHIRNFTDEISMINQFFHVLFRSDVRVRIEASAQCCLALTPKCLELNFSTFHVKLR